MLQLSWGRQKWWARGGPTSPIQVACYKYFPSGLYKFHLVHIGNKGGWNNIYLTSVRLFCQNSTMDFPSSWLCRRINSKTYVASRCIEYRWKDLYAALVRGQHKHQTYECYMKYLFSSPQIYIWAKDISISLRHHQLTMLLPLPFLWLCSNTVYFKIASLP